MGVAAQPGAPLLARHAPHAVDEQLTGAVALAMGRMGGRFAAR